MRRTERGPLRKRVDEFLVDVLRSVVSAASLSLLLALFSLDEVVLPVLGAFVLAAGVVYGGCAFMQEVPPPAAPPASHRLQASERELAMVWILIGLLLALLGAVVQPPPLVASAGGAAACLILHRRGHSLEVRWSQLPEEGLRHLGKSPVTRTLLVLPFLLISYTGFAYAGMQGVQLYKESLSLEADGGREESEPSPGDAGGSGTRRRFSYAELCRELPDPQRIGYGLGDLFEHDGAVAAGCGRPAIRVGETTWVSRGVCDGQLRSLAVVGEGREPILLYGAPARLAWIKAHDRRLRFAEASELNGGEVALVGAENGTVAFTRSSPALRPGREEAVRCEEVDEVARPFVELEPPLAQLWQEHMAAENEWIWPEEAGGASDVVFQGSNGMPVYGSCREDLACRLDGAGLHRSAGGPTTISLEQLKVYASATGSG